MYIVKKDSLPAVKIFDEVVARIFEGGEHNDAGASAFIVDVSSGLGPRTHTHPYPETFIVIDGTVRIEAGDEQTEAVRDDILVVPAGVAHTFRNIGDEPARMVNIHAADKVVTEFVDDPSDVAGYAYHK